MFVNFAQAQENNSIVKRIETPLPGEGKVTIYQDPQVAALIGNKLDVDKQDNTFKVLGYRVQLYAGKNSSKSRNEAYEMAEKAKAFFPDLKVYAHFKTPRWVCEVGDYRTIEEADAMMRKLQRTGGFEEVSIMKGQIVIYL
ncbi:SPOR domain-containing protein [Bacteroides sp. 214]|nr:SPOR domain-containing protein [Bacteroides sp. 214]NDW12316.1 SPOR domain-containing protein [Bacteroides sp. 214]